MDFPVGSDRTHEEAVYLGGRSPKKSDSDVGGLGIGLELDLDVVGEDGGGDKLDECINVKS